MLNVFVELQCNNSWWVAVCPGYKVPQSMWGVSQVSPLSSVIVPCVFIISGVGGFVAVVPSRNATIVRIGIDACVLFMALG